MKTIRFALILCLALLSSPATGQTVVRGDIIRLNTGPCLERSGPGSPQGVVVGSICDTWHNTTDGSVFYKTSGTATSTGWMTWTSSNTASAIMSRNSSNGVEITTVENTAGLLTLAGSTGTRIASGGLHVGTAAIMDPGLGNTALDGYIGSNNFASETIGWRCTFLGACDFRYLFADELRVKLFTAELESVLAGSQRVVKSFSTLSRPFTCPAPGAAADLWVYDAKTFGDAAVFGVTGPPNDWVVIRSMSRVVFGPFSITDCVGEVNSYVDGSGANAGQQMWVFSRPLGFSGGNMSTGEVVAVDNLVQDLGVSGNGFVETSAVDGPQSINAPYTQVVTWTSAPVSANFTVRARFGNLLGITGVSGEYGLIAGTYAGSGGQYIKASNQGVDLQGIDLSMWAGSDVVFKVRRNGTAPYLSIGNPAPGSWGGTGAFLGWSGSATQFSLYTNASNYLLYDGSVLTWKAANTTLDASGNLTASSATLSGSITAGSGAIGGWVLGSNFFYDAAGLCGMSSAVTGGDDVRIWCGGGTLGTAPVRLYESGAFHFGGAGGAIDWNGSALTVSGEGSGLTSLSGGNITTGSITANKIATGTITASQIAGNTITAAQIAAGTITATEIAASTITAAKLNVSSLSAITANLGTVTAGAISGVSITGGALTISTGGSISSGGSFLVNSSGNIFAPTGTIGTLQSTDIVMPGRGGAGNQPACFDSSGNIFRGSGGSC